MRLTAPLSSPGLDFAGSALPSAAAFCCDPVLAGDARGASVDLATPAGVEVVVAEAGAFTGAGPMHREHRTEKVLVVSSSCCLHCDLSPRAALLTAADDRGRHAQSVVTYHPAAAPSHWRHMHPSCVQCMVRAMRVFVGWLSSVGQLLAGWRAPLSFTGGRRARAKQG